MKHAEQQNSIERSQPREFSIQNIKRQELTKTSVAGSCHIKIVGICVESYVFDRRKSLEDVSGTTTDIKNSHTTRCINQLVDKQISMTRPIDQIQKRVIDIRNLEQTFSQSHKLQITN